MSTIRTLALLIVIQFVDCCLQKCDADDCPRENLLNSRQTVLLETGKSGSLHVHCEIQGQRVLLLVDTGCEITTMGMSFIDRMHIRKVADNSVVCRSINGNDIIGLSWSTIPSIKIGCYSWKNHRVIVGDWPTLNPDRNAGTQSNLPRVGILGADFFKYHGAVIDYERNCMIFNTSRQNDATALLGNWQSVGTEKNGILSVGLQQHAQSKLTITPTTFMTTGPAKPYCTTILWLLQTQNNPKIFLTFDSLHKNNSLPSEATGAFYHYEVRPDRLILIKRSSGTKIPLTSMRMTTANDPDAVMYYYVRVGSIPDDRGRTAADYVPWTALAKRYGLALDGPYRVGTFDYSLNRDLSVTGVEVGGPTTITWDLEGSRVVRRGPRVNAPR